MVKLSTIFLLVFLISLAGCVSRPGQQTMATNGFISGTAVVRSYGYHYPAATARTVRLSTPTAVPAESIYASRPFDDPTLVIIRNSSFRTTFAIKIDQGSLFELEPGEVSSNLYLGVGDHTMRVSGTNLSHLGQLKVPERIMMITVRPEGRSQIIILR